MTTQYINPSFSVQNAARLYANMQSTNNTFYVFIGKPQPAANDAAATNLTVTMDYLQRGYYDDMVCGKRIANTNIARMIRRNDWAANTVYDAYDHRTEFLSNTDFYVTVDTGVGIEIFKCISNADGANSTVEPDASLTDPEDMFFELADGYRWKWMGTVGSANAALFSPNSATYVPVEPNANITGNAIHGELVNYVVEDGGRNYNSYANGMFTDVAISGNTYIHALNANASSNNDFYKGCALKIVTGTGAGQQKTISEYIGVSKRVILSSPFEVTPTVTSTYRIAPNIEITGDGSNAEAIAVMNTTSNSIHSVEITNRGQNYTWATATVNGNTGIISANVVVAANTANIVPIISPFGGHGANVYNELFAEYIGVAMQFANTESSTISIDNDFRSMGLISNPLFANVVLGASSVSGSFTVGETITQGNTFATAIVVGYTANALAVANATGRFETGNSTYGIITGGTSAATCQVANITNNSQVKQFETFDQRYRLSVTPISGTLQEDELVEQLTGSVVFANGYIHSTNTTIVGLSNVKGSVTANVQVVGDTSGATANVTAVIRPDLVKQSGDLLYIENIIPVSRGPSQTETLRFVFKL